MKLMRMNPGNDCYTNADDSKRASPPFSDLHRDTAARTSSFQNGNGQAGGSSASSSPLPPPPRSVLPADIRSISCFRWLSGVSGLIRKVIACSSS